MAGIGRKIALSRKRLAKTLGRGSVGDEETGVGAAGADLELDAFGAPRAMSDVGRAGAVGIDPRVGFAAGKVNAQEASGFCRGVRHHGGGRRRGAGEVKSVSEHGGQAGVRTGRTGSGRRCERIGRCRELGNVNDVRGFPQGMGLNRKRWGNAGGRALRPLAPASGGALPNAGDISTIRGPRIRPLGRCATTAIAPTLLFECLDVAGL